MAAGWLALSLQKQGRGAEAQALLSENLERIRKFRISGFTLRSCRTVGAELCLAATEQAEAAGKEAALRDAKAACHELRKHAKADVSALVAAYRLQGTCEWLQGRPKKAEAWRSKSLATADRLGARYDGALTDLEVGRRLGDRAVLEKAGAAFEDIGAAYDLAQAQELLSRTGEKPLAVSHTG